MKTQISRDSFRASKRYSGIYQQQGRMLTDADWNELMEVVKRRLDEAVRDVIGSGAPRDRGLEVLQNFKLQPGVLYVDGVAARLPGTSVINYQDQPDFSEAQSLPLSGADAPSGYVLYADVWERPVTALEDDALLDAGLHGADTCTRTRTMLQIKWCETGIDPADSARNPTIGDAPLTLALWRATSGVDQCDPCASEVDLDARVGNYLFRVEIHQVAHNSDGTLQLTVKWSSENGAEQHPFARLPPGFTQGDWVYEFFNLSCEESLGVHLASSFIPSRGQLTTTFPAVAPAGMPWVRRWDGSCVLNRDSDGIWSLGSGSDKGVVLSTGLDSEAHGYATVDDNLELNLATMALSLGLSTHQFVAGDYWLAPVREASHAPGDTLLTAAVPQGIKHHYLVLAELDSTGVVQVHADDAGRRRMEFPPLSDMWAKDVGYDPENCGESTADTVQEALDWLCQQRDLRFHNKHLHGWGIVCGLQVECGPDTVPKPEQEEAPRREVRIKKGYAIDCEGHDVTLDATEVRDFMALVEAYDVAHPDNPLLVAGQGSVSLSIARGDTGRPELGVERYDPKQEGWGKMLDGTLLLDFYQDCIKGLVEALQDELTADPEEKKALVGPTMRRWISLCNLLVQIVNHDNGQFVFLSRKEHTILKAFYQRLQELLRSKTFCAMFEGDEFPDYPWEKTGLSTIFGKGWHTRLRLTPDGRHAYTCGAADNSIHVFAIEKEEMAAAILMPAGEGAKVLDVAVDPSGKALYAIAVLKTGDTVLGIADIEAQGVYTWRPVRVFCGLTLTCLLVSADGKTLSAIGLGAGLFAFDPATVLTGTNRPDPKYHFNAAGHLSLDENTSQAWATASSGTTVTSTYNQVVGMAMSQAGDNLTPQKTITLANPDTGAVLAGRDDLLVVPGKEAGGTPSLCVVTNRFDATDQHKHILVYAADIFTTTFTLMRTLPVEDSTVRLGWHAPAHRLLATAEDGYRLQVFNLANGTSTTFRHPVQISPVSIACDAKRDRVYVLNFVSNTVSVIPGAELETSEEFLVKLAEYRNQALAAFWGLAGGLLQYLKDCFCHHLLVSCPECAESDTLYLAGVEVRNGKIYKVCNFAKRKYVKSFPTIGYWLSLVPIAPLIKKAVEKVCCLVVPDLFELWYGKVAAGSTDGFTHAKAGGNKFASADLRKGVQMWQGANLKHLWQAEEKNFKLYPKMARDSVLNRIEAVSNVQPGVDRNQVLESQVDEARQRLEHQGVQVESVKSYDRMQDVSKFTAYRQAPVALAPGAKVTLYERDGKVMFYTMAEERGVIAGVSPEVKADIENLEQRKSALRDLSAVNAELAKAEARRAEAMNLAANREELTLLEGQKGQVAREISALKVELAGLQAQRAELSDLSAMASEIGSARTQLEGLRKAREAELAAMAELDARRTEATNAISSMRKEMDTLRAQQQEISLTIARDRPVRDIAGIDSAMEKRLSELGVRTVNDLARVDVNHLTKGQIDEATAKAMVLSAQSRLKVFGG